MKEPFDGAIANLALVVGARQVEHRIRQIRLGHDVGVVDEDPHPARQADPRAVAGVVALGHEAQHVVRQRLEATLGVEEPHGSRALRDEDVGRRALALGVDGEGEVGGVPVADVDAGAGLLGEPLEERADQVLGPARVDDEAVLVAAAGGEEGQHHAQQREGEG